jgi:adenylosuccinate synthase
MRELDSSQQKIGTTGRGIGPAYVDKVDRTGIRMIDLMNEKILEMKLKKRIREINQLLQWKKVDQSINESEMLDEYLKMAEIIKPFITDTSVLLNDAIVNNKKILMEGAQGTLLDVDHGTYPFVTSSNPVSAGACTGCGIGPQKVDNIIGVLKAYTTRVGEGPFPTELRGEEGKYLREVGKEYGATTGRPRRCGWFDAVIARYSARINGLTSLAITKMDVLDQVETIKVCTHYNCEGGTLENFPASIEKLSKCEPVYVDLHGWKMEIENLQSFEDLPENAQKYIGYIEKVTGVPVNMISVGARRESTIFK